MKDPDTDLYLFNSQIPLKPILSLKHINVHMLLLNEK